MTFFAEITGNRIVKVALHVPNRGAWHADCDFESDPGLTGRVTLTLGKLSLVGTIVPELSGVFGERFRCRLVGGADGWSNELASRSYHNDAGVKAILVAEDAARECGETLGAFAPEAERVGIDYVRGGARTASKILEDVIGDRLWWVDFAGVTQVGTRATTTLLDADYRILNFDPRTQLAELSLSDPSVLSIGSVIASPALPAPKTVREYMVQADADSVRVLAWCGGSDRTAGRLADLLRLLVARTSEVAPLLGLYRYRVVRMAVDGRVDLQCVRKGSGVPDVATVSQWPGVAGTHAELSPGAEVLVTFIEGDRTMPIVTHFAGKGGVGFVPVSLVIGGSTGLPAARQNDTVEVLLPPAIFSGTIGGVPATGVITFPLTTTLGQITTGSTKVSVA